MSLRSQTQALRQLLRRATGAHRARAVAERAVDWEGLQVRVAFKNIKSFHLRVKGPDGIVTLSAPYWTGEREIRRVLDLKRDWVKAQRHRFLGAAPRPPRLFSHGEIHHVWGVPYRLAVVEGGRAGIVRSDSKARVLTMTVRRGTGKTYRQRLLERWYRGELLEQVRVLLVKWEPVVERRVSEVRFRQMTSRWGSCHTRAGRIVLNLELARRNPWCLEYVLLHELAHLHERGHNARFYALLERWCPHWREVHAELNQR